MKVKLALTASVLALMVATSAHAARNNMNREYAFVPHITIIETEDTVAAAAKKIRAFMIDDDYYTVTEIFVAAGATAQGLLGKPLLSGEGNVQARIEDILLDDDGDAEKIILSDWGALGVNGKRIIVDFDDVVKNDDGNVYAGLKSSVIKNAAKNIYDGEVPSGYVSVASLLKGNVYDDRGRVVANIKNLTFDDDEAQAVLAFYAGMVNGPKRLAGFEYEDLKIVPRDNRTDVYLNKENSRRFRDFIRIVPN